MLAGERSGMARRLLVPLDGSPPSQEALRYALETFPDATIVLVHVLTPIDGNVGPDGLLSDPAGVVDSQRARAEELFDEAEATAGDDRAVERELLAGRPATEIVECAAEHDIDQIVMGSHGRDGAARLLLGSVSETVVRRSPVPVTVVR
jgi:nucleotide-binding universal stress UspA family protein